MVCGQQHAAMAIVPDGESKHAAQLLHHFSAPLLIAVDDDFSIGMGTEGVSGGNQLSAQFLEVINFAVEGDPYGLIFIAHGLMSGGRKIDDGQPAVLQAYPDGAVGQRKIFKPSIVRAAVMEFQPAFFIRG